MEKKLTRFLSQVRGGNDDRLFHLTWLCVRQDCLKGHKQHSQSEHKGCCEIYCFFGRHHLLSRKPIIFESREWQFQMKHINVIPDTMLLNGRPRRYFQTFIPEYKAPAYL